MFTTKIGFIPLNWDAWNADNWAEQMRDRCVKIMETVPGLDLVLPSKELTGDGCVRNIEQAKDVLALFKKADIEGLIIGNMTFGMEVAVGTILNGLRKDMPILHFCTRSGPIKKDLTRTSDTWCGQFMTASAIKRRGFKFIHINTCNPEDEYFFQKIETFTRSICAISNFKGAKFGQLGTRPQLFESQNWSEQTLQKEFSQMVVPMDLDTVFAEIDAVSKESPLVNKIKTEMIQDVELLGHSEESLTNIARYEIALEKISKELDVNALAVSCWTRLQERYGIAACSTFGRLNDKGIITACEVDLLGAVSMWAVYNAGLRKVIPDFIDWTDLHPTEENVWLAWHCGNAARSLCPATKKKSLVKNAQLLQWCDDCHGALQFMLKPGPVSCARLVEYDGKFTMFFGNGEIVDIPPATTGTYGWVKVNDVFDWENKMIENGIIHHGVLIHDSKVADALEMFCYFLNIQAVRGA